MLGGYNWKQIGSREKLMCVQHKHNVWYVHMSTCYMYDTHVHCLDSLKDSNKTQQMNNNNKSQTDNTEITKTIILTTS